MNNRKTGFSARKLPLILLFTAVITLLAPTAVFAAVSNNSHKPTVVTHKKTTTKKTTKRKKPVTKKKAAAPSLYSTYCPTIGTPISSYASQYRLPGVGRVCFDNFGYPHFTEVLQPPVELNIGRGQRLALIPYSVVGSPSLSLANYVAVLWVPKRGNVKLTQMLLLGFPLNPQDKTLHLKQRISVGLDASYLKNMIPTVPITLLNNWIPADNSFVVTKNSTVAACAISQYTNTIPSSNRPYAEYKFIFTRQGTHFKISHIIARHILNGKYLTCNKL